MASLIRGFDVSRDCVDGPSKEVDDDGHTRTVTTLKESDLPDPDKADD